MGGAPHIAASRGIAWSIDPWRNARYELGAQGAERARTASW